MEASTLAPPELWLAIMRELDCMRDHNAFARTCALFAALARAEAERSKLRLARLSIQARTFDWGRDDCPLPDSCNVMGPFLANGQMHGRCCAYSGWTLICFEAYDDKRQGEACVWVNGKIRPSEALVRSWLNPAGRFDRGLERSWQGQPFCNDAFLRLRSHYVDDLLEGRRYSYGWLEYKEWYSADMASPLWSLDWRAEPPDTQKTFGCTLCYYEDGQREDYAYTFRKDGSPPIRSSRAERGILQSIDHVQYTRNGPIASFSRIEDGEVQGMNIAAGDSATHLAMYKEHGVNAGWSIVYGNRGGVETALYYEDGCVEGPGYFWDSYLHAVSVVNFRGGIALCRRED